ncbi:duodenase-1-like [Sebastes fasciatus]|uniref:duodenase-1-like n=1 Tax=Sebastes fasciatus TaxID=394691 RepID=UPI003D9E9CA0
MHALHKFLLFHVLTCLGLNADVSGIINGEIVEEGSMQYMASLQDNNKEHVCGGFLIREDVVVTAAHCNALRVTSVVLGTHDLKKKEIRRDIEQRYIHDKANGPNGNDIMLLKLSQGAGPNDRVKTIPLPTSEMNTNSTETCSVAGWGYTITNGGVVDDLRVMNVSIIELQDCEKQWRRAHNLPANIICAGGYNTTKGFCQGDSGGPLVCNGKAVGVVSFNRRRNCNYPDVPNVYLDLYKYLPWIKSIFGCMKHE